MPNYKYPSEEYFYKCNSYVNARYSKEPDYFSTLEFVEFNLLTFVGTDGQEKAVYKLIYHLIGDIQQRCHRLSILKFYKLI